VTAAEELPLLAEARDIATVEAAVPHLILSAPECYERLGTYAQINPPIREARHQEALWRAIKEGAIDNIGSDHAPHTRADKDGIYPQTASGLTGVQTLVTLLLDQVHKGRLSLERFADLASAGPARAFGIAGKGRIAAGYDADFTIVDLKARRRIENAWIASRCGWTPYDGMETTGWPVATVLRGAVVMRDGALQGTPKGRALRFLETLSATEA
jgi:dihydroorotase